MRGRSNDEKGEGLPIQLLSAFLINLVALLQGASVSSSSLLHSLLREQPEVFNLTDSSPIPPFDLGFNLSISVEEGSWVASAWVISHFVFAPVAGFINDTIGRRKALMVDAFFFFLGFHILALAPSLPWLILARLLLGCPQVSQVQKN